MSEADRVQAARLRTERRWTDLRAEIEKDVDRAARPVRAALARYTDLVTLATDLARRIVGDTSNLILDPSSTAST